MRWRVFSMAAALVAASVAIGGFASTVRSATNTIAGPSAFHHPNLSGKSIKIVFTGDPAGSEMVLVHAEDLLRQWGADVSASQSGSTTIALGAVASGQADVAEVSPLAGILAVQSGLSLRAFAMSIPKTDDVFVSVPAIKTLGQLKGAKIGILSMAALSGAEAGIALGSAKPSLQYSDASIISAGPTGVRVAGLLAGRLDATAMSYDTYTSSLKSQGYNNLFNFATQMPNFVHSYLWASPGWLSGHSTEALAMNEALLQSFRWFGDPKNKNAFVQLTSKNVIGSTDAENGVIYDTYRSFLFFPPNSVVSNANATVIQTVFHQYNLLPQMLPNSQWTDLTFAKQALRTLGIVKAKKKGH